MFFTSDLVDAYLRYGMKPIPLYWGTKRPIGREWNQGWSKRRCQASFRKYPGANVGLLLGEIMDVEGDTPEANAVLEQITQDYPHPRYKSARSIHHLFVSPNPRITIAHMSHIEFRGSRHQSVVPPSQHESGVRYEWLDWHNIPEMPQPLKELLDQAKICKLKPDKNRKVVFNINHVSSIDPVAQFLSNSLRFGHDVKPGKSKLWCPRCQEIVFVSTNRLKLEVVAFKTFGHKWSCNGCRDIDVRGMIPDLRKALG